MRSTNKLFALVGVVLLVTLTFGPAAVGAVSVANGNDPGNAPDDAGNAPDDGDNFGIEVSNFVHDLLSSDVPDNETFGTMVAEFVLANNPAADKIPDHAGPPDHAGNAGAGGQGPPDHAGPPDDAGNAGGPPDNAGNAGNGGQGGQGGNNGGNGGNGGSSAQADESDKGADGRDRGQ